MEYNKFLSLARKYRADETENEYRYMELLVAQKADVLNWKKPRTPYETWPELLREEGLCTYPMFQSYVKAKTVLDGAWIKRLGVYASVSLAKLDRDTQAEVLSSVKRWYGQHRVAPTYQRVSKYVRDLGRSSRKMKVDSRVQKMKAYIKVCQALLKQHHISVPKETWT